MSALVSSLLTEINQSDFKSEGEKENTKAKLISRLLLSDWNDSVESIVPLLFTMISHSEVTEKLQGWRLLPLLLRSQYRRHVFVVKPLCQFIDKQALVHSITTARQSSTLIMDAIGEGVNSILALSLDVNEVSTSIEGQLVKLIGSTLDVIKDPSSCVASSLFAMQVLTKVIIAKGRLFNPQQLNKIISASFLLLSDAQLNVAAANLLAVSAANGPCELYESMFKCLSHECTRLLQILGLGLGSAAERIGQQPAESSNKSTDVLVGLRLPVDTESRSGGLTGVQKAMFVEVCFRGLCAALGQMALLGCSAGPLAQDFRADVAAALNVAICHRSVVNSKEAKFTMENRASISPAHVSVVWPQLTLHALSLLAVLLASVGPSPIMYQFAGVACSCVSSALAHVFPNNKKVDAGGCSDVLTACSIKALECFKYLIRCFPTLVVTKCEQILLKFVDVVTQQVQYLTSDPQLQMDAAAEEASSNSFCTNKCVVLTSFELCESLLIAASPLLSIAVRQQLELAARRGLQCLMKGVLLHSFLTLDQGGNTLTPQRLLKHVQHNKKVRRDICEALRCDVQLQKHFLLMACAEAQTSYVDGSRSSNLPLLSAAAAACCSHDVTASVCGRIGLCVGNVLFPAGVGLPSPPLIEAAHRKILEHDSYIDQVHGRKPSSGSGTSDEVEEEEEERGGESDTEAFTRLSKKRKGSEAAESDDDIDLTVRKVAATSAHESPRAAAASSVDWTRTSTPAAHKPASRSPASKVKDASSDDDDDDELPDIDIDADIDA